jgi:hypothetical protein
MPRTQIVFDWIFGLTPTPEGRGYELTYETVPNVGMNDDTLEQRIAKEHIGIDALARRIGTIQTMQDVHACVPTPLY